MNLLSYVILLHHSILYTTAATNFYCTLDSSGEKILNADEGNIITLFQGTNHYSNNMVCIWHIDAGPGKRIQLMVHSSNLQYSPQDVLCDGYDHVDVREGDSALASWCGHKYPEFVLSRGQEMTITFVSDHNNPFQHEYRGVHMVFKTFDSSKCPPGWIKSGQACFVRRHKDNSSWSDAQEMCSFEQSNLASIISRDEYIALSESFETDGKTWIGLNDIASHGKFTWIDRQNANDSFARNLTKLSPIRYKHCAAANFKMKELTVEDCDRSAFPYLCRTPLGQPSKLYAVPQGETDKGDGKDKSASALVLGICISLGIVLVIVITGVSIWRKRGCNRGNTSSRSKHYTAAAGQETRPPQPTALTPQSLTEFPSSAPLAPLSSQHVAPPTYEESVKHTVIIN